jgi:hypothetical protein
MGVGSKVRTLALARLRANAHVIHRWHEACYVRVLFKAMLTRCRQSRSWLAQPTYVPASLSELAKLADETWFLAGDQMDNSWYTKRVTLSTIYSVTEVFKTQDKSANFTETEQFLDSRLEDLKTVPVGGFMGHFTVNVLRSKADLNRCVRCLTTISMREAQSVLDLVDVPDLQQPTGGRIPPITIYSTLKYCSNWSGKGTIRNHMIDRGSYLYEVVTGPFTRSSFVR